MSYFTNYSHENSGKNIIDKNFITHIYERRIFMKRLLIIGTLSIFIIFSGCSNSQSIKPQGSSQTVKSSPAPSAVLPLPSIHAAQPTPIQPFPSAQAVKPTPKANMAKPSTLSSAKKSKTPVTAKKGTGKTSVPKSTANLFTAASLSKYNGQNGKPAYVAVNGVVYDVTHAPKWHNGQHVSGITAGQDLTQAIADSPHGTSVLKNLPVVGKMKK